ncbi:MAG: tRNA guanosine(34) transglycosylase Tgt [Dehalococcoidia bacterium]|nr:tRNA guanosine(34) transglycosylase Tgt [Dehalococcoidia bacterium]
MQELFHLQAVCPETGARAGKLVTPHGTVETPVFMPVGSQGTVKTLTPPDLESLGVQIILANTYHLYLRPGIDTVKELGGLHRFMAWNGPILTDSGGFQIFSLGHLRRINDEGALFRSHIDGSEQFLTPELAIRAQEDLGADVIMVLDECPPYGGTRDAIRRATERTHLWAEKSRKFHKREDQALFGIVQGGTFADLRRQSVEYLRSLDFPGYAVGGLSLGEPKEITYSVLADTITMLPADKPRYLMGVGSPEDLVECVARGADMFDSALPTRLARNGALFGENRRINIFNSRFEREAGPLDRGCDCYTCRTFPAAYLHHLFKARELLAYRLATIHNIRYIVRLMAKTRKAIQDGAYGDFKKEFLAGYEPTDPGIRAEQKRKWLLSRGVEGSP